MRTTVRALVVLGAATAAAFGMTEVMSVGPVRASWAAVGDSVSQVVTLNVDTLVRVDFFVGLNWGNEPYNVKVFSYPGGITELANATSEPPSRGHVWLPFNLTTAHPDSFVKGRRYRVEVTRGGTQDSIHYYFAEDPNSPTATGPYKYGQMIVGGTGQPQKDLCVRCYGLLKVIDSTYWGMNPGFEFRKGSSAKQRWVDWSKEAGVGAIRVDQRWYHSKPWRDSNYVWARLDSNLKWIGDNAGHDVLLLLIGVSKWASTRFQEYDSSSDTSRTTQMFLDSCVYCPPRGLWATGDSNYWAVYLKALVDHIDERGWPVHDWEIGNEPNEGCTLSPSFPKGGWPGYTGWWRRPNDTSAYKVSSDSDDMCSLYVRLCEVAANTIRSDPDHMNDKILIGSLARVDWHPNDPQDTFRIVEGRDWLRLFYEFAKDSGGPGIFWDGVSVHPYQTYLERKEFSSDTFYGNADTLRAIMDYYGHNDGELWITELGWSWRPDSADSTVLRNRAARNLCKTFVSAKASEVLHRARYDRTFWWLFDATEKSSSCPLIRRDVVVKYPSFYACEQASSLLDGQRFNRRVLAGDSSDDSVRMYEFTDANDSLRLWVCWRYRGTADVEVRLPVRADTVYPEPLAYDSTVSLPVPIGAAVDGWLHVALDSTPMFIREGEEWEISRPDVRVDSLVFQPPMLTAWFTNHGNRATPDDENMPVECPTWVTFYCDDDSIGEAKYDEVIAPDIQVSVSLQIGEVPSEACLYSARANPDQFYVERYGLDDNAGYLLKEEE